MIKVYITTKVTLQSALTSNSQASVYVQHTMYIESLTLGQFASLFVASKLFSPMLSLEMQTKTCKACHLSNIRLWPQVTLDCSKTRLHAYCLKINA